MASDHFKRLSKKYGKENITGKKYRTLMEELIEKNSKAVTGRLAKMNQDQWKDALKRITPKEKRFVLPDVRSVIPTDSFFVNKAAENGKLLTDNLRQSLNKDLRDTLTTFTEKTGEQNFIARRGRTAGQINPKLIDQFEQKITNTFKTYTKKDPKYGVPSNVRDIAVTEMNSTVNNLKANYMNQAIESNPDLISSKKWLHHPERSKKRPRKGHSIVGSQKPRPFDKPFKVPNYRDIGGRQVRVGYVWMDYPHDPNAPLDQKVNCHCEVTYFIRWRK